AAGGGERDEGEEGDHGRGAEPQTPDPAGGTGDKDGMVRSRRHGEAEETGVDAQQRRGGRCAPAAPAGAPRGTDRRRCPPAAPPPRWPLRTGRRLLPGRGMGGSRLGPPLPPPPRGTPAAAPLGTSTTALVAKARLARVAASASAGSRASRQAAGMKKSGRA